MDNGCTNHVIISHQHFYEFINLKIAASVKLGNNNVMKATKVGNVLCKFDSVCNDRKVKIKNVFYVSDIRKNLLSVSSMYRRGTVLILKEIIVRFSIIIIH